MAQEEKDYIENRQIRIFISSTFKDMQAEREYLVTRIFPELRRYCEERDVSLFELDLRWGITQEDSENQRAFKICLDEVNKAKPFFIGLLGERYGWIPSEEEIKKMSDSFILEEYPMVQEDLKRRVSITETEIMEGALRPTENMKAYFYFRSSLMETPDEFREKSGSYEEKMLLELKDKIRNDKRYAVKEYYDIGNLGGLVERDFKALIDELFPTDEIPSKFEKEHRKQRAFLKNLTKVYAEDETLYKTLDEFAEGKDNIFVITGEKGIGKSALLANWIVYRQNKNIKNEKIIHYFVNTSEKTYESTDIISGIENEIAVSYNLYTSEDEWGIDLSADVCSYSLDVALSLLPENEKLIIVLDGFDCLFDERYIRIFECIFKHSEKLQLIFSTLSDDSTMEALSKNNYKHIILNALTVEKRKDLINKYYDSYKKKLMPELVNKIAEAKLSENPYFLISILNNLRIFGTHVFLNEQIEEFVKLDSYEKLINFFLIKIEGSYGNSKELKDMVKDILSLILVSKNGLSEDVILDIVKIPELYWTQFFNNISEYLSIDNELIIISNEVMKNAVRNRHLKDIDTENIYRMKIITCLERYSNEDFLSLKESYELPYQLYILKEWDKLYNILLNHIYFMDINKKDYEGIIEYWRALREIDIIKYDIRKYNEIGSKLDEFNIMYFYNIILNLINETFDYDYLLRLEFALKYQFYSNFHDEGYSSDFELGRGEKIKLILLICRLYTLLEKYEKAIEEYKKFIELCNNWLEKALQQENISSFLVDYIYSSEYTRINTYYSYFNIGFCYSSLNNFNEAIIYYNKAIEIIKICDIDSKNQELIDTYKNISMCFYNLGKYQEALKYDTECYALQEKLFEKEDPDFISTISDIGVENYKLGNYQKALEYHLEALNLRIKIFNELHEDVALSYNEVGMVYEALGEKEKAKDYFNKEKEIKEKLIDSKDDKNKDTKHDVYKEKSDKRNENDDKEEDLIINKKISSTEEAIELFKKDISSIITIPNKYLTEEYYLEAAKYYPNIIKQIPEESLNEKIIYNAVKQDVGIFYRINKNSKIKKYITSEIYILAIKKDSSNFNFIHDELIPYELITKEFCFTTAVNTINTISIPLDYLTTDICEIEVFKTEIDKYSSILKYIPDKFITKSLCLTAVKLNGMELSGVPENLKTEVIIITAVKQNGEALEYVPENQKTYEICLIAIKQNGKAIEYVPNNLKTSELYAAAVDHFINCFRFEDVPEEYKTIEVCKAGIMQHSYNLKYVPDNLITLELFQIAINNDGSALKFVPDEFITQELCLIAINKDGSALEFIPDIYKTQELCIMAIKNKGEAIEFIPKKLQTVDFYLFAVTQNSFALEFVPDKYKTIEVCSASVNQNFNMHEFVPEEIKPQVENTIKKIIYTEKKQISTNEVIKFLIDLFDFNGNVLVEYPKNGDFYGDYEGTENSVEVPQEVFNEVFKSRYITFTKIPDKFKTKEMCLAAIEQNIIMIHYVPKELLNYEIYMEAIKNDGAVLAIVPDELITSEMCLIAVKSRGFVLFAVPKELKTKEICIEAVKQNNAALEYVPEELVLEVKEAISI